MKPVYLLDEVNFAGDVRRGAKGMRARRAQEWLCLHSFGVRIDEDFGGITEQAVAGFQLALGLPESGVVDLVTWEALVRPMKEAIAPVYPGDTSIHTAFMAVLAQHMVAKPREIGGNNRGPWVRLYMRGVDGPKQHWCAGSATSMLAQAYAAIGQESPFDYHINCNRLADAARELGALSQGESVEDGDYTGLFLEEKSDSDDPGEKYGHTGAFTSIKRGIAKTIEGNFGPGDSGRMAAYHRDLKKNDIIRPL